MSRRRVLAAAGGTGLLAATASSARAAMRSRKGRAGFGGDAGTPEQIHLTWGDDPATSVVVSWASPGPATRPQVRIGQRVIPAEPRQYTDGLNGETVWTYHARVGGLRPGATYAYMPDNHVPGFAGLWYSFRIGSVLFISLDADDVVYQDAGAFVAGPAALTPAAGTGNPPIAPGTSFYIRGYSGGAQTGWLEQTLAASRRDAEVDWIIVQMHQCAASSSATGNGSDLGIRQQWLPLFDRYQVDLVLTGHDHDYERSFPVRGADLDAGHEVATGAVVNTLRPHPVTTEDTGVFDTSQGTVHLILGCGGTDGNLDDYGTDPAYGRPQAKVFTCANRPVLTSAPSVYGRAAADAVEDAIWSARRDTTSGYGIAVFDVDPEGAEPDGQTAITVTQYHAVGADPVNPATGDKGAPTPDYTDFEAFKLVRPRSR